MAKKEQKQGTDYPTRMKLLVSALKNPYWTDNNLALQSTVDGMGETLTKLSETVDALTGQQQKLLELSAAEGAQKPVTRGKKTIRSKKADKPMQDCLKETSANVRLLSRHMSQLQSDINNILDVIIPKILHDLHTPEGETEFDRSLEAKEVKEEIAAIKKGYEQDKDFFPDMLAYLCSVPGEKGEEEKETPEMKRFLAYLKRTSVEDILTDTDAFEKKFKNSKTLAGLKGMAMLSAVNRIREESELIGHAMQLASDVFGKLTDTIALFDDGKPGKGRR